jgi:hypothetical protein
LIDRGLDAGRHVADPAEGFRDGVRALAEGNQLAPGVGQFGELEWRLCPEVAELGQSFLGLGGIADESGECHFGGLEVRRRVDRLHATRHDRRTSGQRPADAGLEGGSSQGKAYLQCRRPAFAKSRQVGSGGRTHPPG